LPTVLLWVARKAMQLGWQTEPQTGLRMATQWELPTVLLWVSRKVSRLGLSKEPQTGLPMERL